MAVKGLEIPPLRGFKDIYTHENGIDRAAAYGWQMGLNEVAYVVFVELSTEEANQLEKDVDKPGIKVTVIPIGIL